MVGESRLNEEYLICRNIILNNAAAADSDDNECKGYVYGCM